MSVQLDRDMILEAKPFGRTGLSVSPQVGRVSCPRNGNIAKILDNAIEAGLTFLDVTNVLNVKGIDEALKERAEKLSIAVHFGLWAKSGETKVDSSPPAVRAACEYALDKLGVDSIDLFYQNVHDPAVPLETTVLTLKELVLEGKVKYIGLAGCNPALLPILHSHHPISAVALDWSVWNPGGSDKLVDMCRSMGIAVLATQPLALGINNMRTEAPKDVGEKIGALLERHHKRLVTRMEKIQSRPSAALTNRARTVIKSQMQQFTEVVGRMTTRQNAAFAEKLGKALAGTRPNLSGRMAQIVERQHKNLMTTVNTLLGKKFEAVSGRLDGLKDKPNAKVMTVISKMMTRQTQTMAEKLANLRGKQHEVVLEKIAARLGKDTGTAKMVETLFAEQRAGLVKRMKTLCTAQATTLMTKLGDLETKKNQEMIEKVKVVFTNREEALKKQLAAVCGKRCRATVPPKIGQVLKRQKEAASKKLDAVQEAGFKGMKKKVMNLSKAQNERILTHIQSAIEKKNTAVAKRACSAFLDNGDDLPDTEKAEIGRKILEKCGDVTSRVAAVAKEKGVAPCVVALGWVHGQGEDVFPVIPMVGDRGLDKCKKCASLDMDANELGFLSGRNERLSKQEREHGEDGGLKFQPPRQGDTGPPTNAGNRTGDAGRTEEASGSGGTSTDDWSMV